ncbi:hypothetical protein TorRG33x02_318890, partial [Trema orientale]
MLEDMDKVMTTSTITFPQETKSTFKDLETQISQFASAMKQLQVEKSIQQPFLTLYSYKKNVSALMYRSCNMMEDTYQEELGAMKDYESMLDSEAEIECHNFAR